MDCIVRSDGSQGEGNGEKDDAGQGENRTMGAHVASGNEKARGEEARGGKCSLLKISCQVKYTILMRIYVQQTGTRRSRCLESPPRLDGPAGAVGAAQE